MGGIFMKLINLTVEELYGCYNYNVQFNEDVTFLYGMNGCGKTTILNITEAIITGRLYELFNYKFKKIELTYAENLKSENAENIFIKHTNSNELLVSFNNRDYIVENLIAKRSFDRDVTYRDSVYRAYFNKYDFLEQIQSLFNYVYLPLNRKIPFHADVESGDFMVMRRYINSIESDIPVESRDAVMMQIEALISNNYSKINSQISSINDNFRNEIMESSLKINGKYDPETFFKDILVGENAINTLLKTKSAYIKILTELKIISKEQEEYYIKFFDNFIKEFKKLKKDKIKTNTFDLIMQYQEISKIKDMISIVENMEKLKSQAREPLEIFLKTMNEFVGNSEDGKEIGIDAMGRVYFTTQYNKEHISIQHLSSGEKQLITFFANLIFKVDNKTRGIFVVDEPELSLHLSWQKIFVEKTLSINKNIQLIFATHAPEIIGRRRNKMYKLEKKYVNKEEFKNG